MKKILAILLLTGGLAQAAQPVWLSSNTATADTTQNLCKGLSNASGFFSNNHGIFHGACINTGVAGTLTIYNSSATATSPIAAINTGTAQPCSLYDVSISSGLTYTNSATANVTILYQCY
jgi:hypothetical protein